MSDIDPASRRSGEPGITASVCQPLLRLQQLPQELLFSPGLGVVRPLVGQRRRYENKERDELFTRFWNKT